MSKSIYNYVKVKELPPMPLIQLDNLAAFAGFVKMIKPPFIMVVENKQGQENGQQVIRDFIAAYEHFLYAIKSVSFDSVEDYEEASERGFDSADDYYQALKEGHNHFKEFDEARKAGADNKDLFRKAQRAGFIDNWKTLLDQINKSDRRLIAFNDPKLMRADNGVAVYEYAVAHGFMDFKEFEKGVMNSFATKNEMLAAKTGGFEGGEDFRQAMMEGFERKEEWREARNAGIHSKKEYTIYEMVKRVVKQTRMSYAEAVLFQYLVSLPNAKKVSVHRLNEGLNEFLLPYVPHLVKGNLPAWVGQNQISIGEAETFFSENKYLRKIGHYDSGGEYFEIFKPRESKVFIDASNVAYYNVDKNQTRPLLRNILLLINELKNQQFQNVVIIADASLKHRVADAQTMTQLQRTGSLMEVPAGTPADKFIIEQAKKERGGIVSNDTFRDWKLKDAWVAEHYDQIRIPFVIEGDRVTLSLGARFEL